MAMRRQFVLDKKTNRMLNDLAADRGGNRSRIIRDAIQAYAEREAYLDRIEADPAFLKMMAESGKAFREGRFVTQEELEAELRVAKRKKRPR